jgi:hypothetical protein
MKELRRRLFLVVVCLPFRYLIIFNFAAVISSIAAKCFLLI